MANCHEKTVDVCENLVTRAVCPSQHDSHFTLFKKQTKTEGGQSGTYQRQTRVSSGLRVIVAQTYRDEMK